MKLPVILTLDAGGTNLVFSAYQGDEMLCESLNLKTAHKCLDSSIDQIISGFSIIKNKLAVTPSAISIAFPGPADYEQGIIGDLPNLKVFRGGVPLGAILEEKFSIPTFINNDGDLFSLGEAYYGALKDLNESLKKNNKEKRYKNLLAITLGTGFGAGIVNDGRLLLGDNGSGAEIWLTRCFGEKNHNAEQLVGSIAIQRLYRELSGHKGEINPFEVYQIAKEQRPGDKTAALESFRVMGEAIGEALANALSLLDCPVVIGGGLSNAVDLFGPQMMKTLRKEYDTNSGDKLHRLCVSPYLLTDESEKVDFFSLEEKIITVPNSDRKLSYNEKKAIPIMLSTIGANRAISLGAVSYAYTKLEEAQKNI